MEVVISKTIIFWAFKNKTNKRALIRLLLICMVHNLISFGICAMHGKQKYFSGEEANVLGVSS